MGDGTRFRDLGTLLVDIGGDVRPVGGARLDAALALLLVHSDQRVGSAEISAAIWGVDAAPRSSSTLDSHVWRLRNVLEPDRARGVRSSLLIHEQGGFRLVVSTGQVDSLRFEQLAEEAGDLLGSGQPQRALRRVDEALGLWRGRPFAPYSDEAWAVPAVARLEEMHGQLRERRIEAHLAVGEPERALAELDQVLAGAPLREGLWAQRMLALHRLGRTDDALRTYRRAHTVVTAELGMEPGPGLRELHARILAGDPLLPSPPRPPAPPSSEVTVRLPTRRGPLVGRGEDLRRLAELITSCPLTTIVGTAGCGKTRLAIEAARAAAAAFPDGVRFVDLTAAVDAAGVLTAVPSAIGLSVASAGSPREAVQMFARGRRMLLVLDNCEHVLDAAADLVEGLLGEGSELAVLATSREPLDVDGEHVELVAPLALPYPGSADPTAAAAVELFLERLPGEPGRVRTDEEIGLAARIATAVDGVPLALELAAARARAFSLAEIADQVAADPSSLSRIGRGAHLRHDTVRDAVHGSYRLLPASDALLHRRLCAVPGPFTADLAAALVGGTTADEDVADGLTRLVHRSLLVPVGPLRPDGVSRFTQLATVRGHATHAAGDEAGDAVERRDRWAVRLARAQPRLGAPAERAWMEALDDDIAGVRACLQRNLVDAPTAAGITLAARLGLYSYYRGTVIEGQRWMECACSAPAPADPLERGMVRLGVGVFLCLQTRADLAAPHLESGMATLRNAVDADPLMLGDALSQLAGALYSVGARRLLAESTAQLHRLAARTGDEHLALLADTSRLHLRLLDGEPARDLLAGWTAVHARATELGNSYVVWTTAMRAATVCLVGDRPREGLDWSDRMIDTQLGLGVRNGAAAFGIRANLLAAAGSDVEAVRLFAAARNHHRSVGQRWPRDDLTRALFERATSRLERRAAEQAGAEGHTLTLADLADRAPAGTVR